MNISLNLQRTHEFLLFSSLFLIPYRPWTARKINTLETQASALGMAPLRMSIVNWSATHIRTTVGSLSIRKIGQMPGMARGWVDTYSSFAPEAFELGLRANAPK
jgi:hypothetical protein